VAGSLLDKASLATKSDSVAQNRRRVAGLLLAGVPPRDDVMTLSSLTPTVSTSALGAGNAANNHSAPPITNAVMRQLRRVGTSTTVDIDNDPHFEWLGRPIMVYGTSYPDYFAARVALLTGGSSQAAGWRPALRFIYTGQSLAVRLKTTSTALLYRLRINGRYVTTALQSLSVSSGQLLDLVVDLGSAATRDIVVEIEDPYICGVWIEPTATITRGHTKRLRLVCFGDSITAAANGVRGVRHMATTRRGSSWRRIQQHRHRR
jgi:hypothetical protein